MLFFAVIIKIGISAAMGTIVHCISTVFHAEIFVYKFEANIM